MIEGAGRTDWGAWAATFDAGSARERTSAAGDASGASPSRLRFLSTRPFRPLATAGDATCTVALCGVLHRPKPPATSAEAANDDALWILHAYRERGESALEDLRGTFVVILWDRAEDLLLCARDPLGIFPLFYAEAGDGLAFSTSIESLLRVEGVPRTVNRGALAAHLGSLHLRRDATFFQAIRRVPPGHVFRWKRGSRAVARYWDPLPAEPRIRWIQDDVSQRFRQLFDQAVERCLGGKRIGIFLSGGLDSASVAAVALERCRQSAWPAPVALSQIFPDPECNEEPVQRGIAAQLGIDQVCATFGEVAPNGFLRASLELSGRLPAPLHNFWLPAYRALGSTARERGCEAIITGGGGDEWLCVTPMLAADLIRSLDFAGLYRLSRVIPNSYQLPFRVLARHLLWTCGMRPLLGAAVARGLDRFAPDLLRAKRRAYLPVPSWISADPELRAEIERELEPVPSPFAVGGFYALETRLALDHYLFSMESEENFESVRQGALPVGKPFLDADLVGLLCRIHPDRLCSNERTKGLVREMLSDRFPGLGFERQKKVQAVGFFRSLIRAEGPDVWAEMGGLGALTKLGIIDEKRVRLTVDGLLIHNDPTASASEIGHILISEAWLRSRS